MEAHLLPRSPCCKILQEDIPTQVPPGMETGPSLHRPLPGAYVVTPRAVPPTAPIPGSLSDRLGSQMGPDPNLTPYTGCFLDAGGGVQPHFSLPAGMWDAAVALVRSPTPGVFSPRPRPLCLPPARSPVLASA